MKWRRRPSPPAPDPWEEEGRRVAAAVSEASAAVVLGAVSEATARVAIGIARAVAKTRRVALADLAGASPSLRALAGDGDPRGISDCFLHGLSLNAVARPAADGTPSLFILPCGSESPVPEGVLASDRWSRLTSGFGEAGALLLLVAAADTAGLAALVAQTDGVVSVGDAKTPLEWRVLAQVDDQATPEPACGSMGRGRRAPGSVRRLVTAGVLAVTLLVIIALSWSPTGTEGMRGSLRTLSRAVSRAVSRALSSGSASGNASSGTIAGADAPAVAVAAAPRGITPAATPAPARVDTVSVGVPVNPRDSANAADFAVELVATNTSAGANLWIRERGTLLPGVTVSPVLLGSGQVRWHKVFAGAWRDRGEADSSLASLQKDGVLRAQAGVVRRVPLALLLEADVPRGVAPARVASLVNRGIRAYALLQDDGTARLFAGAFESAAAAVPLGADLRAAGLAPQLAYRTGRTF